MTDIIERLRIESRREPHEPIWRDAIDEIEALRGALEEAEEAMRFVHASCATFPQEPQHVQNAAWRRIVNAIAKVRTALAKENSNDASGSDR